LPATVSRERFVEAAVAAASVWSKPSVPCTAVRIRVQESALQYQGGTRDGSNTIVFQTKRWCRAGVDRAGNCYDRRAASYTTLHFARTPASARETEIEEADIELNAVDHGWDERSGADLTWYLAHEIGHLLGFAHICRRASESRPVGAASSHDAPVCSNPLPAAIMAPLPRKSGSSRRIALDSDSRLGVCAVYPASQ
jgi:hypothetical protein